MRPERWIAPRGEKVGLNKDPTKLKLIMTQVQFNPTCHPPPLNCLSLCNQVMSWKLVLTVLKHMMPHDNVHTLLDKIKELKDMQKCEFDLLLLECLVAKEFRQPQ